MRILAVVATALLAAACVVPRDRVNDDCRWVPGSADLTTEAVIAEELAIRYADAHRGLRSPGQYVGPDEYAAAREECLARLVGAIAASRNVTPADVRSALRRRSWMFDAGVVFLPMLLLFCAGAVWAVRAIERRFGPDERAARATSLVLASAVLDLLVFQLGSTWSFIAEERVRLHTTHLSYRAAFPPWGRHGLAILLAGVVLFWTIVAIRAAARRNQRPALSS